MRIGIDARFYGPRCAGLGRYSEELVKHLASLDQKNEYLVFLRPPEYAEFAIPANNFKKILANFAPYSLAEQLFFPFLIRRTKVDLMHFTHFNAPILYGGPFVVTIHDLILKKFPTIRPGITRRLKYFFKNLFYDFSLKLVAKKALKIIAVSRFTREDIKKELKTPEAKIEVVYEGISSLSVGSASKERRDRILRKYGVKKPFFLYAGNSYPHKNLPFLLEGFEKLLEEKDFPENFQLVLVGKKDDFSRALENKFHRVCREFPEAKRKFCTSVIFTGFVKDNELAALYQEAFLYIFPSLYEGFGFPGLEAMLFDLPVLSSRASCLPEIFGPAACYFNPCDWKDFIEKSKLMVQDQFYRQKLASLGRQQVKKFNWPEIAQKTLDIYKTVLPALRD